MKRSISFSEFYDYCKLSNVNITKWDILSLAKKYNSGKQLSDSEKLAKIFLEEMGNYMKLGDGITERRVV